ncbi:hypothetical protein F4779DRAFT_633205 [Xylariaceae sp. FL0662B]|nr:hypothetical protein F4779DRAFT_633205 [Xylariaceae sp. FL0662B]
MASGRRSNDTRDHPLTDLTNLIGPDSLSGVHPAVASRLQRAAYIEDDDDDGLPAPPNPTRHPRRRLAVPRAEIPPTSGATFIPNTTDPDHPNFLPDISRVPAAPPAAPPTSGATFIPNTTEPGHPNFLPDLSGFDPWVGPSVIYTALHPPSVISAALQPGQLYPPAQGYPPLAPPSPGQVHSGEAYPARQDPARQDPARHSPDSPDAELHLEFALALVWFVSHVINNPVTLEEDWGGAEPLTEEDEALLVRRCYTQLVRESQPIVRLVLRYQDFDEVSRGAFDAFYDVVEAQFDRLLAERMRRRRR